MKLAPTQLGGSPKQMKFLGGLVVVLIAVYFYNRTPSSPEASITPAPAAAPTPVPVSPMGPRPVPKAATPTAPRSSGRGGHVEDFHPSIKLKEGTDVSKIDPTLELGLLAKLRKVPLEGGSRSVFDFGQAPPPVDIPKVGAIRPGPIGPMPPGPGQPGGPPLPKPVPPPPPPIPLKFYGYGGLRGGAKRAFVIDGEEIQVAGENDMIRNRYKIVRIGVNSVVVEDTTNHNQQTLPMVEEMPG